MTAAKPAAARVQIQLVQIVQHVERHLPDLQHVGLGDVRRPALAVVVAAHGGDGRDPAERVEDVRRADVARVHDALDAGQRGQRLRPHQAVRVGDHADGVNAGSHRGLPLGSGGDRQGLEPDALADRHARGIGVDQDREDAVAADLHDREHTGPAKPAGSPVSCTVKPWTVPSPAGRTTRRHRCRTPHRSRAAARRCGRSRRSASCSAALPQPRVELVQLRVVGRLQRERIDGAEVAHGTTGHLVSIGTPARRTCSRLSRSTRA